ncbi:hypothetical protein BGX26_004972, partial [Mortierella sp. AD094]
MDQAKSVLDSGKPLQDDSKSRAYNVWPSAHQAGSKGNCCDRNRAGSEDDDSDPDFDFSTTQILYEKTSVSLGYQEFKDQEARIRRCYEQQLQQQEERYRQEIRSLKAQHTLQMES